jgi:SAM-dependent methyltransferase
MGTGEESRVQLEAAERYETELAVTVLLKTATHMVDRADIEPGLSVLDVGCGTGVVARQCFRRAGPNGTVTGLDISREMLAVADRVAPDVGWVQGDAGLLPFPSELFDRVLSQFALMFFPDKEHALGEMWRVLRPGGRLVVSVSGALRDSPVNLKLAGLVERHVGEIGRAVVEDIWTSGAPELGAIFTRAGITSVTLTTEDETTEYPSIKSFVETEVRGWAPLSELVDDTTLDSLVEDARRELAPRLSGDGHLRFNSPYHMVVAVKELQPGPHS